MKNPLESFEPVSASGSEKPWNAYDSEFIARSREKPTPVAAQGLEEAPDTERTEETKRSSDAPSSASRRSVPESSPMESGERVIHTTHKRIHVSANPDFGFRRGEPVTGDRAKAPFALSAVEESNDQEAAA